MGEGGGGGGGGGVLPYFHTYIWLGPFFGVQNFEIQYLFGVWGRRFRKYEKFCGYEEIVDIFGRSLHYWTKDH